MEAYRLTPELAVLQHTEPVPGRGFLPINSYLLLGSQPVLIDMGPVRHRAAFLEALESLVDPADIEWLILTHPDGDHLGALPELLERAPGARLVLNWISTGKLNASLVPPLPRILWMNQGESLMAGDRVLHFLEPPMYDCPSTTAVFDSKTRALFSSDAFGAMIPRASRSLAELPSAEVFEGMSAFCRANSPWLADVRPDRYESQLAALARLEPSHLLGSHLPPAGAREVLPVMRRAAAFPGEGRVPPPGQAALQAALDSLGKAA